MNDIKWNLHGTLSVSLGLFKQCKQPPLQVTHDDCSICKTCSFRCCRRHQKGIMISIIIILKLLHLNKNKPRGEVQAKVQQRPKLFCTACSSLIYIILQDHLQTFSTDMENSQLLMSTKHTPAVNRRKDLTGK